MKSGVVIYLFVSKQVPRVINVEQPATCRYCFKPTEVFGIWVYLGISDITVDQY